MANWLIIKIIMPIKYKAVRENSRFIGRAFEQQRISEITQSHEAAILTVYGRRRVGKTELIEQVFRNRNLIKFEGFEGFDKNSQIQNFLRQLASYSQKSFLEKGVITTWQDALGVLTEHLPQKKITLFFEELQWLANYDSELISVLKYYWDNFWRHYPGIILVLCGSSPSFMINQVVRSKALYNRSQHEIHLKEFSLQEVKKFLKPSRSLNEVMDAYLAVGGIPEYLKYLDRGSSIYLGLCKNSFTTGSFFFNEYEKILTSNLAENPHYKKIIEYLSIHKFATREQIADYLKIESGGSLSKVLQDLEVCGFISRYVPYNLKENSLLSRYSIADQYLQFYFKFIHPIKSQISAGDFNANPTHALNTDVYAQWLGYSFERLCRKMHRQIAQILGFEGVQYQHGAYFSRAADKTLSGFQLDLVFDRKDKVLSICEIKYKKSLGTAKVAQEFKRKIDLIPIKKSQTVQKILITADADHQSFLDEGHFDRVITLEYFFKLT